jgi:hypothetical protein
MWRLARQTKPFAASTARPFTLGEAGGLKHSRRSAQPPRGSHQHHPTRQGAEAARHLTETGFRPTPTRLTDLPENRHFMIVVDPW